MSSKAEKALLASLQQSLNDSKAAQAAQQAKVDAAIEQAKTPDPFSAEIGNQAKAVLDWSKGGDFSQAPKGVFFDFVDPAMKKRQRDLASNAGAQGISALGTPNTTLLNLNKQNLDDEFARDEAGNYQTNVSNAVGNAANVAGTLGAQETAKKFNILDALDGGLNTAANQTNNASSNYFNYDAKLASQPSGWGKFFNGLAGATGLAGSALTDLFTGGAGAAANSAQKLSGQKLSDYRLSILQ